MPVIADSCWKGVDLGFPEGEAGSCRETDGRLKRVISSLSFYNISVKQNILTSLAQKLRREATKEENRLWYEFLSFYPIRFRRQVVIGKLIVDFYCSSAKLAIELDGGQHYEDSALSHDDERTQWLNHNGIRVLRFLNSDLNNHLTDVCSTIDAVVKERLKQLAK